MSNKWALWALALGIPASLVEAISQLTAEGGALSVSTVLQLIALVVIGVWFWLPDKDHNQVPDVLNGLGTKTSDLLKKWVVPILLALASALGVSQLGCGGATSEELRTVEWHGATVDGTVDGELHLVEGAWTGAGRVGLDATAAWRLSAVEQTASASVEVTQDALTLRQSLASDVATWVEVEQTLLCVVTWADLVIDCEVCGRTGELELCKPFGNQEPSESGPIEEVP